MATPRYADVVGQFPQLKSYNHGLLVFPLADGKSQELVAALEAAIEKIVAAIPWLGEHVVHVPGEEGSSGLFKTEPWPTDLTVAKRILYVQDRREQCPTYQEFLDKKGPVSMFDAGLLCPFPGFPMPYDEAKLGGAAPVVAVQASFIQGGVVLNFSNQHNMMDASGMFVFIMLLATVMSGRALPPSLVDQANLDRAKVIPLLGPDEPLRDHSHLLGTPPARKPPRPDVRWAFFLMPKSAVAAIKAAASDAAEFDPPTTFVSTNDALCAFYWQRLAAVRVANGSVGDPAAASSKFSRAIDARAAVGAPWGYMGQMVYHAATRATYADLTALSLSRLASRMRADLEQSNTAWAVRSYATFIAGVPDKGRLVYAGGIDPDLDVGSSSMAQTGTGGLDFGPLLGSPTLLRRPNLVPLQGFMYVFPPEFDTGDLPILVCLTEQDMEGMKSDSEWGTSTTFVG